MLLSKTHENDFMRIAGKANGTIKEHLSKLKQKDFLKRVGGRKTGYWEIIEGEYDNN